MPDAKTPQTFISATVLLQPGLEADIREKLAEAFGAQAEGTPVKVYRAFEDLMAALLADWLKSGKPVPEEIIRKWKDVSRLPPAGLESVIQYEAERSMPCEKSAQTLRDALRELAKNVRCGSRGGNWNSPLWFFGYEPGGCRCREDGSKYTMLDTDVCSAVDLGFLPDDERFAELNYPYARKLAAFVRNLLGETDVDASNAGLKKAIAVHRLFCAAGIGCDCNLYPVQRPNQGIWDQLGVMYKGIDFGLAGQYRIDQNDASPAYPKCIEGDRREAWHKHLKKVLRQHPIVIIANGQRDKFETILADPSPLLGLRLPRISWTFPFENLDSINPGCVKVCLSACRIFQVMDSPTNCLPDEPRGSAGTSKGELGAEASGSSGSAPHSLNLKTRIRDVHQHRTQIYRLQQSQHLD